MTKRFFLTALLTGLSLGQLRAAPADELGQRLAVIRAVGPEGRGNAEASRAWRDVSRADQPAIPAILAAMDGANDFTANWLRAAVDAIASREASAAGQLPLAELGQFLLDTRHSPRARRMAFDLIARTDATVTDKLLPGMLNDPSLELRRDAVQQVIQQGSLLLTNGNKPGATLLFQQALNFARDVDQIDGVSKSLRELGRPVDLATHFGFLTQWKVIGPFDNTGGKGFDTVFPPEQKVDFAAEYDGKQGKVRWQSFVSKHEYGMVDINQPCGKLKEVTAYAITDFYADKAQPAELRLGGKNSWKIWFNGQLLFGRDEYHRAAEIDQYRMPVTLQPGRNTILVKVCQNEQVEDWTVEWEFQLRITDALGTPIHSTRNPVLAGAQIISTASTRSN